MFGSFSLFPLVWRVFKSFWNEEHKKIRECWNLFPLRYIDKNPRRMYPRVLHATAQFVFKIEKLTHIIGTALIRKKARLRSPFLINGYSSVTRMVCICMSLMYSVVCTGMYPYVTLLLLVCTNESCILLVCIRTYVTRMYSCGV